MRPESLHNHTTHSDGKLTYPEIFRLAEGHGVGVMAFTDHDALPDRDALAFLDSVRDREMKWVIGIEMTSALPRELGGKIVGDFHIVGLFVDPENVALKDHCERAQAARIDRMEGIVRNLQGLGFDITAEDCLRASGGESVGRPHIVEALHAKPENLAVEERLRGEMEEAAKSDTSIAERYAVMMGQGPKQYPYGLYLTPTSFRPAYVEHTYMPPMDDAVALIRGAGGIAILAHYFTVAGRISTEMLEGFFRDGRLDGAEVLYGLSFEGTSREKEIVEQRRAVAEIVSRTGALRSAGADTHHAEDLGFYLPQAAEVSPGMAEVMLRSGKADRRFSSFL
jgi:predicted metal-dependent phosphoesterase TrpH